ncbi:MAG: hypothetical protein K8R21_04320, partial [Leptospira sp.]|nr:hypothetical protein [Leptospira sp.]
MKSLLPGICLLASVSLFAETDHSALALQFYKEGKFKEARIHSRAAMAIRETENINKNVLSVYVLTENDLTKLHDVLSRIYSIKESIPENFYDQVYALLERSLVSGDMETGLKWGTRFKKEAKAGKNYARGLYLYSCILNESGKIREALFVAKEAVSLLPDKKLDEKLRLFRISNLESEEIAEKESLEFLDKHPESEFTDRIIYKLIRFYESKKEDK